MLDVSGTVTMQEAARRLGISHTKIWRLVKDGVLTAQSNPRDGREKLIRVADIERLEQRRAEPPHFVSDGIVDVPVAPSAADLEEYVRTHWYL